tara:strand:- start:1775 stop:2158 length:384 start_codon:yes stop_codon:yes gene_type:complete
MPEHCRHRFWIIVILVVAIGFAAIPAHAESIFGSTFSTTDVGIFGPVPDVTPRASRGDSGSFGSAGEGIFGSTFSISDSDVFGPVPDVTPRASRGDSGSFGGTGLSGSSDGGIFGPVPDVTPRASQN